MTQTAWRSGQTVAGQNDSKPVCNAAAQGSAVATKLVVTVARWNFFDNRGATIVRLPSPRLSLFNKEPSDSRRVRSCPSVRHAAADTGLEEVFFWWERWKRGGGVVTPPSLLSLLATNLKLVWGLGK